MSTNGRAWNSPGSDSNHGGGSRKSRSNLSGNSAKGKSRLIAPLSGAAPSIASEMASLVIHFAHQNWHFLGPDPSDYPRHKFETPVNGSVTQITIRRDRNSTFRRIPRKTSSFRHGRDFCGLVITPVHWPAPDPFDCPRIDESNQRNASKEDTKFNRRLRAKTIWKYGFLCFSLRYPIAGPLKVIGPTSCVYWKLLAVASFE